MTPQLDTIGQDLGEARAMIEATRSALEPALDGQDGNVPEMSRAITRVDRIEAELTRIEGVISGQAAAVR